jgi:hypothetical protein
MTEVKLRLCPHESVARRCRDTSLKQSDSLVVGDRRRQAPDSSSRFEFSRTRSPPVQDLSPAQRGGAATPLVRPDLTSSRADVWHLSLSLSGELAASGIRLHGFRGYECEY